ncbi:MAG: YggS family pyridoxal phosphate-dependent enzyme [Adlercreutzia equolifaciens]
MPKSAAFPEARWHFIGNIQSRRISEIVASSTLIHSCTNDAMPRKSIMQPPSFPRCRTLIEVNVSGEASKSGWRRPRRPICVRAWPPCPTCPCALMTMAPAGDAQAAREAFAGLAELAVQIRAQLPAEDAAVFTELSMGMSDDWREAVPLGATIVRVGRAIFSESYQE